MGRLRDPNAGSLFPLAGELGEFGLPEFELPANPLQFLLLAMGLPSILPYSESLHPPAAVNFLSRLPPLDSLLPLLLSAANCFSRLPPRRKFSLGWCSGAIPRPSDFVPGACKLFHNV